MKPSLLAFAAELVKVGETMPMDLEIGEDPVVRGIVSSGIHSAPRRYGATMALAAAATPLMTLLSRRVGQLVHNRSVMKAVEGATSRSARKKLLKQLKTGKVWGANFGHVPGSEPLMTPSSLSGDIATGAVTGSVIQALRDRLNARRSDR